jgi:hypothetical protein
MSHKAATAFGKDTDILTDEDTSFQSDAEVSLGIGPGVFPFFGPLFFGSISLGDDVDGFVNLANNEVKDFVG